MTLSRLPERTPPRGCLPPGPPRPPDAVPSCSLYPPRRRRAFAIDFSGHPRKKCGGFDHALPWEGGPGVLFERQGGKSRGVGGGCRLFWRRPGGVLGQPGPPGAHGPCKRRREPLLPAGFSADVTPVPGPELCLCF